MSEQSLVVNIVQMGQMLDVSVRTIRKHLRHGTWPIPMIPGIDRKQRWSRALVEKFANEGHALQYVGRRRKAA